MQGRMLLYIQCPTGQHRVANTISGVWRRPLAEMSSCDQQKMVEELVEHTYARRDEQKLQPCSSKSARLGPTLDSRRVSATPPGFDRRIVKTV